ncbi:MAG: TolC family protein [Candidatus Eiseniibacteriota bacterium]|nr:MAG: TolC family protein [Candidatus Eisenbacteria bacterium]
MRTEAQPAARRLSLEESVELALVNNKQLLIQKQEVDAMEGRVVQARAGALPNLSAESRYIQSGGTMNFGGSEGFTFNIDDAYLETSVSLLQPIYTAGRTGAALRAADAARGYARENELATAADVVYQVKASFAGVLLARRMSVLAGEALALAQAHREDVEELFNEGLASEYELIRARVREAELVPEQIRSRNELQRSLIIFRNSLGLPADEAIEPDGELSYDDVHISTAEAFSLAKENRHEIAAAKLYAKGMRAALDLARADRYPSLALAGSATMNTEEASLEPDRWRSRMWTLALAMSIPMFDGLYTKGKIKQSRAQYEQALLYAAQVEDIVRLEVEQAVSRLEETRELVESQLASVEQAQKGMDIANIRYENGVGTQLEVLDSQVALSRAKTNYFVSVFEQFMAVAEIERATGGHLE